MSLRSCQQPSLSSVQAAALRSLGEEALPAKKTSAADPSAAASRSGCLGPGVPETQHMHVTPTALLELSLISCAKLLAQCNLKRHIFFVIGVQARMVFDYSTVQPPGTVRNACFCSFQLHL